MCHPTQAERDDEIEKLNCAFDAELKHKFRLDEQE
jgi:hypothetical protein